MARWTDPRSRPWPNAEPKREKRWLLAGARKGIQWKGDLHVGNDRIEPRAVGDRGAGEKCVAQDVGAKLVDRARIAGCDIHRRRTGRGIGLAGLRPFIAETFHLIDLAEFLSVGVAHGARLLSQTVMDRVCEYRG